MISQALSLLRRLNAPGWKPYSPDLSAARDELSRSEKQAADVCFLLAWVIRFISPGSVYWEWEHIQDNTFPQCSHRNISAIPQEDPAATETLSIPVNIEKCGSAGVRLLSKLNVKRNLRTSDRSYTTKANRSTQTTVSENGGWLREGNKGGETNVSRNTIISYTNTHNYVQEILKSTWFNLICMHYMHDKPT